MMIVTSLTLAVFAGAPVGDWASTIRDAQLANIALFDHGHTRFEMRWKPRRNVPEVRLRGEAWWRKNEYRLSYQIRDLEGFVAGIPSDPRPLKDQPLNQLLRTKTINDHYLPGPNTLLIQTTEPVVGYDLLQFRPRDKWFVTGGPQKGRPWVEMVGLEVAGENGTKSTNEYVRVGDGVVKQIRRDPDGGVLETEFSIPESSNPVKSNYRGKDVRNYGKSMYQWRSMGDAWVLVTAEETRGFIHPGTKEADESIYRLDVMEVDLDEPPASVFDQAKFMKQANGDTIIVDRVRGRTFKAQVVDGVPDAALDRLVEELRARGPAKRP